MLDCNCLVIGVGNPDRGDDRVGRIVAQQLKTRCSTGVMVLEHDGETASLMECLSGADWAYVVDASVTGRPAGTISRFDVATAELPRHAFGCSTHGMGLAQAVELARALGRLPQRCVIYAVEGHRYGLGEMLSPEVAAAAGEVANLIRNEICHPREG
jgi:hydrogenase maturation protease